jgi:aryl-alcohol dehydrogenase-like predicted oxidoreductase
MAARQPRRQRSIVGATKTAHLADAVAAVGVSLSEEERTRLEARYRPHRVLGHA